MKIVRSHSGRFVPITMLAVIAAAAALAPAPALAADSSAPKSGAPAPVVAFRPAINGMVDVLTPQGSPREYTTASGTTLWSPGSSLFIYKGDKIRLNVFVSTGAFELHHVKVRLDNVSLASIDHQPWNVVVDTNTLETGYHMFQIWAQSDSPAPYSSSEQNISFYLSGNEAPAPVPAAAAPPTAALPPMASAASSASAATPSAPATVAAPSSGDATTATGSYSGTISSGGEPHAVPVSASPINALPKLIESSSLASDATLQMKVGTDRVVTGVDDRQIVLNAPLDAVVIKPKGSAAQRFAYALYRDGAIVYQTDQFLPVNGTHIRLQARTGSSPGLLPGSIVLKAWGIDQGGKYGPVVSVPINIPLSSTEETVK
ncbi:MAG: hypothetical protein P4L33_15425 [Capsulimonadaceae bacterium]|nr:hypothetical protein [Capsulimonadaceae bacterium]